MATENLRIIPTITCLSAGHRQAIRQARVPLDPSLPLSIGARNLTSITCQIKMS